MNEQDRATTRVLFIIDNLRPGGAQKALLAMALAVRDAGMEPEVWCLGGTSEIEGRFAARGVTVTGARGSAWRTLATPVWMPWRVRRRRVAVVQTFLFYSDICGRLAGWVARWTQRGRRPVVVSSARATNLRNRWWQFMLQRTTAPLADAFTAVSARTLEFAAAREGVDRSRARVIANGIDLSGFAAMPERAAARVALGLPAEAVVFGTIGRLHEQKGHGHLLTAAVEVVAAHPKALFLIAGYGSLEGELKSRAQALGLAERVRFLGYRTDVPALLAAMDVFVLPSLWEGMSNAVLEAMAAGRPVIATAVDGNVDQVADGVTGLLVPPGDAKALAAAMDRLARDPDGAREMGRRGRERAEREFSLTRMTEAYVALYRSLMKESGSDV
jgi:glycosyltransferase involved in cell wall biosynthesis